MEVTMPVSNGGSILVRGANSDSELNLFLDQLRENGWLFNHEEYLAGDRTLVATLHECEEVEGFKEASFKLFQEDKELNCLLPGFLLSPDHESLDLESEINRACKYLLNKHLIPTDDKRIINAGEFTYVIEKIIINSVKNKSEVELIVEAKKKKFHRERKGGVEYFVNETMPELTGGPRSARVKVLAEFIRAYLNSYYESFGVNYSQNATNDSRTRAINICHTLVNKLLISDEPKVFKRYPAEIVQDNTGLFSGRIVFYDLERELFRTVPRFEIQMFYDIGFPGVSKEEKEFRKEEFMKKLSAEDRAFYEKDLEELRKNKYLDLPLRLRIISGIIK